MSEPNKKKPSVPAPQAIKSLPTKPVKGAETVKGGAARAGGDDDDLDELQVQR
jgi:hypothetical protein